MALTFADGKRRAPIAARHTHQLRRANQRVAIDARQLHSGAEPRLVVARLQATLGRYLGAADRPHHHLDGVVVAGRRRAGVNAAVILDRMEYAEAILERAVASLVRYPALGIVAERVVDGPFRVAEASHPQALHVHGGARIHNQFAVVALGDRAVVVAQQDCWRLFHWEKWTLSCHPIANAFAVRRVFFFENSLTRVVILLIEPIANWFRASPLGVDACAHIIAEHLILADVRASEWGGRGVVKLKRNKK